MSDAPHRVIFVNRVYWPSLAATAQLLTDLAEGLAARGWPVHVIAAGAESGIVNGVEIHRTGRGEAHGGLCSRTFNYWRFTQCARKRITTLAQPGDFVVLMTDPPLLGAGLTASALDRGAHVIHWIQDIYPEILGAHLGPFASIPLRPLQWKRDNVWQAATCCVTLGADMARFIRSRKVRPEQIAVGPNWAPQKLHTPADQRAVEACRAKWGVRDEFVVAYSGNLGRVHEFSTVLDAAEHMRDNAAIRFFFIGHGARFDELRTASSARRLTNIRFLPPEPIENLATALAAADAHLVTLKPAFAELVFPSKLAGVLAAGRPVLFVGPTNGEIAQLLGNEKCGQSIAPGDGARMAEILIHWQGDFILRRQLGEAARLTYLKHFTFDRALGQWEAILRR